MKYRKKPVVIEAFRWTGGPDQTEDSKWICEAIKKGDVWFEDDKGRETRQNVVCMVIRTLEGYVYASVGDFIIKGIKGELYPCKPDIFEQTYEKVEEEKEDK